MPARKFEDKKEIGYSSLLVLLLLLFDFRFVKTECTILYCNFSKQSIGIYNGWIIMITNKSESLLNASILVKEGPNG